MAYPLAVGDPLGDSLRVCGIATLHGHRGIVTQGYMTVEQLGELRVDDVDDLCKSMSSITRQQDGKFNMPMRSRVNIKAMVWWIRDLNARGRPIPAVGFTAADLAQAREQMQQGEGSSSEKNPIELPGKFNPRDWVGWWELVTNYLKGQKGASGKPLYYIVRKRNPQAVFPDNETREAYEMPLARTHFNADNQTVYRILKSLTLGSIGYAWVQPADASSDGQMAALGLMDKYDGTAEVLNRFNMAKQEIEEAEYRGNEGVYPFNKYASVLQKAFTTMAESKRPKAQTNQVDELLKRMKIPVNNPYYTEYTGIKMQAKRDHPENFGAAVAQIASEISMNIPVTAAAGGSIQRGNKRYRGVSAVDTRSRGQGRTGNRSGRPFGRGRGGRSSDLASQTSASTKSTVVNGVDIGNPTRRFTQEEMEMLGRDGRAIMYEQRKRFNKRNGGRGGRGNRDSNRGRGGRQIGAVQQQDQPEEVSQITEATGTETATGNHSGRGGRTGNCFGRGRHVGAIKVIARAKVNGPAQKVKAAVMRDIPNLPNEFNIHSRNEMDTMADTSCAGKNWTPIYFTGDTVDVAPFAPDQYEPMKQIPFATCATIITTQTGKEWMVIGNEMLYFGEKMDRSLVNPNQVRMNSIKVSDDPTEDPFGIAAPELFIPFEVKGAAIFWQSRAPSFDEIDDMDILHLVITSDEPWDPQTIDLQPTGRKGFEYGPEMDYEIRHIGKLGSLATRPIEKTSINEYEGIWDDDEDSYVEKRFIRKMISAVRVEPDTRHQDGTAEPLGGT